MAYGKSKLGPTEKMRTGRMEMPTGGGPAKNVAGTGSPASGSPKMSTIMGHGERCATAEHTMGKGHKS